MGRTVKRSFKTGGGGKAEEFQMHELPALGNAAMIAQDDFRKWKYENVPQKIVSWLRHRWAKTLIFSSFSILFLDSFENIEFISSKFIYK